jgi:3-isopropylmalate/(R)-2-methylmalate dehydratase small subunit
MHVWQYGDNVDTDMLFPGKYVYTCSSPEEIKPHLLEDLDPMFAKNVTKGDIILAGKNFGCGSSREQPVVGLKAVGITAVVAESFARIFYRASINQGLLLIESPPVLKAYNKGDSVSVDIEKGVITVNTHSFSFPKLPQEILAIRNAGGLLPYTRRKLKQKNKK